MRRWKTSDGRVLEEGEVAFQLFDAVSYRLLQSFENRSYSDEDKLWTWTYSVRGTDLVERTVVEGDRSTRDTEEVVVQGLEPVEDPTSPSSASSDPPKQAAGPRAGVLAWLRQILRRAPAGRGGEAPPPPEASVGSFGPRACGSMLATEWDAEKRGQLVDSLLEMARSEDREVRIGAVRELGYQAPAARQVLDELSRIFADIGDASLRAEAVRSAARFGFHARSLVPQLEAFLEDSSAELRREAALALSWVAPSPGCVAALVELLQSGEPESVKRAAGGLARLGALGVPALQDLVRALGSDGPWAEPELRRRPVAAACVAIGPEAVPGLRWSLRQDDPGAAISASVALAALGDAAPETLSVLEALLGEGDVEDVICSAIALAKLGHATPMVKRTLVAALGHRFDVVGPLVEQGVGVVEEVVAHIRVALDAGVEDASQAAFRRRNTVVAGLDVLRGLGHEASGAAAQIRGFTNVKNAVVRARSVSALAAVEPDSELARATLVARLDDRDDWVRLHAASGLVSQGEVPGRVVRLLCDAAKADSDGDRREWALLELGVLDPPAGEVLALFEQALAQDRDTRVRLAAAEGLVRWGASAAAVETLTGIVQAELPFIVEQDEMPQWSGHPDPSALRKRAVAALAELPESPAIREALEVARLDAEPALRRAADAALADRN